MHGSPDAVIGAPPHVGPAPERILAAAADTQRATVIDAYNRRPLLSAFAFLAPCLETNARVLDLGCGGGDYCRAVASLGLQAFGVDIDADLLRRARVRDGSCGPHYCVASLGSLPFADASFDATFCVSVLQYVDWRRTLRQCYRVLRPGGRAFFVENLAGSPLAKAYRAYRRTCWAYPPNLTPRRHVAYSELHEFREVFPQVETDFYHLTTQVLLLPYALREPRPPRLGHWAERCFEALNRLDVALIRRVPSVRTLSWLVGIHCRKPLTSGVETDQEGACASY